MAFVIGILLAPEPRLKARATITNRKLATDY